MSETKQRVTKKENCEELKKENEGLKQRVKELEKQIATYNLHFAQGKVK